MINRAARAKKWLYANENKLLWAAIAAYIIGFSAVCLWKYAIYAYNGIDLAYFNQVFWNTLHGRFFRQSIHPHSSLGDHAELIIPLLSLLYAFLPDPRGLLILQTAVLGLSAWPLYLIAKEHLHTSRRTERSLTPLFIALAWLLSPFVQNINIYEFHILPFALLPLFFALLFYEKKRMLPFLLFSVAALLIREDVALVIAAVGILAWIERKPLKWRIVPLALGGAWFFGAMQLIRHFAPAGNYKYMIYYDWLGGSFGRMAVNAVLHPLRLIEHLLTIGNLEMILGFGLPLFFLPFVRPRHLILALGPLLQIVLGAPGGGEVVLDTHYATLFLPAIFLAGLEGFLWLRKRTTPLFGIRPPDLTVMLHIGLIVAVTYGMLVLGPLPSAFKKIVAGTGMDDARLATAMLKKIPPTAPVAASYGLLPALSSRERLVSLHYVFLGMTQFAEGPYPIPEGVPYVALDTDDLLTYRAQFLHTTWAAPYHQGGEERLRRLAGEPVYAAGRYALYDTEASTPPDNIPVEHVASQHFPDGILLEAANASFTADGMLDVNTLWSADREKVKDATVRIRLRDAAGDVALEASFPWGNGLDDGPADDFQITWRGPKGMYLPEISLVNENAALVLDGIRSNVRLVADSTEIGQATLPWLEMK